MEYVYTNKSSLSPTLCEQIIAKFEGEEKDNNTRPGTTGAGINPKIKDTVDFTIEHGESWGRIRKCLEKELLFNLEKYATDMNKKYTEHNYKVMPQETFFETFQLQRYRKQVGKYVYHQDGSMDKEREATRVLTYLWYLNDVHEGGETELCMDTKIKPETGKLLLFPASWLYPHSGLMPISNDKYIITGWLYTKMY